MDSSLTIEGRDPDLGWQFVEKYLLTFWLAAKCASTSLYPFTRLSELRDIVNDTTIVGNHRKRFQPLHDDAMAIAARSGDEWAIQSFDMSGIRYDWDFWKSLRELNPPLYHRNIANNFSLLLDEKEIAMHALKAYSIDRQGSTAMGFDDYLSYLAPNRDDFGVLEDSIESLLEEDQIEDKLIHPWEVDRAKRFERLWREEFGDRQSED